MWSGLAPAADLLLSIHRRLVARAEALTDQLIETELLGTGDVDRAIHWRAHGDPTDRLGDVISRHDPMSPVPPMMTSFMVVCPFLCVRVAANVVERVVAATQVT